MRHSPEQPLVILDRDGVLNEDSDQYVKSADEWIPIEGSLAAVGKLKNAGFKVAVATNQSGLARGYFDEFALARMHEKLQQELNQLTDTNIDLIVWCPHAPDEGCSCRKPEPGLLLQIAEELSADLAGAWFIGDSLKDLQAAVSVGAQPVLVLTGKGKATRDASTLPNNTLVFESLEAATEALLKSCA
jgi:D-glycero-D-manno-heptose 1,7-bisphosphate phosphatase